jgi:hypothetical protein
MFTKLEVLHGAPLPEAHTNGFKKKKRNVEHMVVMYAREMPRWGSVSKRARDWKKAKECGAKAPAQEPMLFSEDSAFSGMATGSA